MAEREPPWGRIWAVLLAGWLLAGCSSRFDQHRASLGRAWGSGDVQASRELLDRQSDPLGDGLHDETGVYGSKNRLLLHLERGGVLLAQGDYAGSLRALNRAEEILAIEGGLPSGGGLGQWMIGERAAPFRPAAYERQYVNVLKMIAHVGAGRFDVDAPVEARRLARNANDLRDAYLYGIEATENEGGEPLGKAVAGAPAWVRGRNREGRFLESPAGIYFTGVAALADRDLNTADVALRRLDDALTEHRELAETSNLWVFDDMAIGGPSPNVLLVAMSGVGPHLESTGFGPYLVGGLPTLFELPRLVRGGSEIERVQAELRRESERGILGDVVLVDLGRLEELSVVAEENHRRELPLIYRRTALRSLVKAGAVTLGGVAGGVATGRPSVGLLGLGAAIGVLAVTERADTRAWTTLPGAIWARSASLEPGRYAVRLVFEGAAGGVVDVGRWQNIEVSERGVAGVVGRYRR